MPGSRTFDSLARVTFVGLALGGACPPLHASADRSVGTDGHPAPTAPTAVTVEHGVHLPRSRSGGPSLWLEAESAASDAPGEVRVRATLEGQRLSLHGTLGAELAADASAALSASTAVEAAGLPGVVPLFELGIAGAPGAAAGFLLMGLRVALSPLFVLEAEVRSRGVVAVDAHEVTILLQGDLD